jgi:CRISPR-associated exonuclease Cas4
MIPINLIRQYHFCPRIVYYNLLTNIKPIYPRHVSLGEDYHKIQEKLSKNRKFKKLKIYYEKMIINKYLEDESLEISGIIDLALITKTSVIPIEFKENLTKKPNYSHILQLYGYGYLLQKNFNLDFTQAFIIYDKGIKFHHINITSKIKESFLNTLEKIKKIINHGILPSSSATDKQCSQCEYLNFCDDRI